MLIVEICENAVPRIYEAKSIFDAVSWHDQIHKTDVNKWMMERGRVPLFKVDFIESARTHDGYSRKILDEEYAAYLERMGEAWKVYIFDGMAEAKMFDWAELHPQHAETMKRALACLESFQRSDVDEDGMRSVPVRRW